MISHALIQSYVRNISIEGFMKSYYPSYITSPLHKILSRSYLNGCCAKPASNLDAKVDLLTLSDPRQNKKCVFQFS